MNWSNDGGHLKFPKLRHHDVDNFTLERYINTDLCKIQIYGYYGKLSFQSNITTPFFKVHLEKNVIFSHKLYFVNNLFFYMLTLYI